MCLWLWGVRASWVYQHCLQLCTCGLHIAQLPTWRDKPLENRKRNSSIAICLCSEAVILLQNLTDDFLNFSLLHFSSVWNGHSHSCLATESWELRTEYTNWTCELHQWRPTCCSCMIWLHLWQLIFPGLTVAQRLPNHIFFPHGRSWLHKNYWKPHWVTGCSAQPFSATELWDSREIIIISCWWALSSHLIEIFWLRAVQ